jgi:hypothetical protein
VEDRGPRGQVFVAGVRVPHLTPEKARTQTSAVTGSTHLCVPATTWIRHDSPRMENAAKS